MTHKNNGKDFWLQVVPESITDPYDILEYTSNYLPSAGRWLIQSDSSTITEEQAAELVELLPNKEYLNYKNGLPYRTAVGAFYSLLSSLNISSRVIILEKL